MSNGDKLDIKEMKKIAHEIIEEEAKKYNIKLEVFPLTFVEYKKSSLSKFKLNKENKYKSIMGGYYSRRGKVLVCLDNIKKLNILDLN